MGLSIIAARSTNGVIGRAGNLPWNLPADMKFFRETTGKCPLIMGRKTFDSLPNVLFDREHLVISKSIHYVSNRQVKVFNTLEGAIRYVGSQRTFVIGGGEIYEQTIDLCNEIFMTEVRSDIEGDVYFPQMDWLEWNSENIMEEKVSLSNQLEFSIYRYWRKHNDYTV